MRILILALAALFAFGACAESLPSQAGLDAAQALVAMHDAVMTDVLETEYSFSSLAGGDGLFVLYTDAEARSYLMVSLGEDRDSADMAVIQSYSLAEFEKHALMSLTALAIPFVPEENWEAFESWRDSTALSVRGAASKGNDLELTYYTGDYIACAMSAYHDDAGPMFTALISWHETLTAEDITARMEGMENGSGTEADNQ